jgi:serine/threonine-protein kinase
VLAGKYRVERVLGQGGMGVVVAARHVQLGELVAIKFLLSEMTVDPEVVQRFAREARAAVRIKSEHVARVSDVGALENGAPYMVMEYLDGNDLGAVLAKQGPLAQEDAVDFVAQACEAIAEAHALGIVHRDLKPSNLMAVVRSDGSLCVKVLDFGISKITQAGDGPDLVRTKTAMALGSPLYMSPEQMVSARDVDGRTDIWALGAILYELVSGRTPFVAESFAALVLEVTQGQLTPLGQVRRGVPAGLAAVVARCLAKDRKDRYDTVADLALALMPFAPERARLPIERAVRILRGSGSSNAAIQETLAQSMRQPQPSASGVGRSSPVASERSPQFPTSVNWAHTAKGGTKRRTTTLLVLGGFAVAGIAVATYLHGRDVSALQQSSSGEAASPSGALPAVVNTASTVPASSPAKAVAASPEPAATHEETPSASASVPSITPAAPQTAAASVTAPQPNIVSHPTRQGRAAKGRAAAPSPVAATPVSPASPAAPAAAPPPPPAPAPQPTAPKGSAYDDM